MEIIVVMTTQVCEFVKSIQLYTSNEFTFTYELFCNEIYM